MKKLVMACAIIATVITAASFVSKASAFGLKVPTSVKDVANAPADAAYDSCKAWAEAHKNNMAYNSANIKSQMTGKDFENCITEKDWTHKNASDYDKKNKRLEIRCDYMKLVKLDVNCNAEKCASIYCNKK